MRSSGAGSAATLALARRGLRVLGLDRFSPPHRLGSTHGRSRVIRDAYYESPIHVPLVRRAYELWEALAQDSGRRLLWKTGGLMLGTPDGTLVTGARRLSVGRLPVFIWEWVRDRLFYGIPDHGAGFKVARHHEGDPVSADAVDRSVRPAEIAEICTILERTIPDAAGTPVEAVTCLYINTPDQHFVLGRHPAEPRVLIASPCSGHGFKFASAIGEVLADLVTTGSSRFDLSPFRPDRFER